MLVIKDISKKVQIGNKEMEILKDINLEIKEGEIVSICGRSGGGKSTLLGIMSGIDKPTDGKVLYNDTDIYSLPESKLAQMRNSHFGIIFQDYQLISEMSVIENVEVPLLLSQKPKMKKNDLVDILHKVGMEGSENTKVSLLSGGEKQRVAIARVIAQHPEIIFADEPTGALDYDNSRAIMSLLLKIRKEFHTSIVLVTHDISVAKLADRIVSLDYGTASVFNQGDKVIEKAISNM